MAKCDGCGSSAGHKPNCPWLQNIDPCVAEGIPGVQAPATRAEDDGPEYEETDVVATEPTKPFWRPLEPTAFTEALARTRRTPIRDGRCRMIPLAERGDLGDHAADAMKYSLEGTAISRFHTWMRGTWDLPREAAAVMRGQEMRMKWETQADGVHVMMNFGDRDADYVISFKELQKAASEQGVVMLMNGDKAFFVWPEQYAILEAAKDIPQEDLEAFAVQDPDEPLAKLANAVLNAQKALLFPRSTKKAL